MQNEIREISNFYGIRYITKKDVRNYAIHSISQDFVSMPGWDMWDTSIHEAPGQYERLKRSTASTAIIVLAYDPQYKLAKIQGKTAVYLTSCQRCSCPDYRKRHLPCKHMYALAIELDGDIDKQITDPKCKRLEGFAFALGGHFKKGHDKTESIRDKIYKEGGQWSDSISHDSTALVTGASPSAAKMNFAKELDIEILTEETLDQLFTQRS